MANPFSRFIPKSVRRSTPAIKPATLPNSGLDKSLGEKGSQWNKDAWDLERKRRRKETSDWYWSQKRKINASNRSERRELKKRFERKKKEILGEYNVKRIDAKDKSWEQKRVREKLGEFERREDNEYRRDVHKGEKELKRERSDRYSKITRDMKREYKKGRDEEMRAWMEKRKPPMAPRKN